MWSPCGDELLNGESISIARDLDLIGDSGKSLNCLALRRPDALRRPTRAE
jgi:hypothetical protein